MGAAAVVYYVAMSFLSENLLSDSISSISLFIAFYYALTGFACVWYFRGTLRESARNLWFRGILPLLGALILTAAFFVSAVQMWDPAYGDTQIFGVGGAFVSGVVLLGAGRGAGRGLPVPAVHAGLFPGQAARSAPRSRAMTHAP